MSRYLRQSAMQLVNVFYRSLLNVESIIFCAALPHEATGGHLGRQTRCLVRLIRMPTAQAAPSAPQSGATDARKLWEQLPDQAQLPYFGAPLLISNGRHQVTLASIQVCQHAVSGPDWTGIKTPGRLC